VSENPNPDAIRELLDSSKAVEILPNSVTRERCGEVWLADAAGGGKWMTWVYCGSCSLKSPHMFSRDEIDPENGTFVSWLCDDCFAKHGAPFGCMVLPDEVFWRETLIPAQQEAYGRQLEPHEIEDQLRDPNSLMSKLARHRHDTVFQKKGQ
jgi:hypothetical protein